MGVILPCWWVWVDLCKGLLLKQTAIEVGHTYGKHRMCVILNNQGYNIGTYQTASLMKKADVVAICPRKRHYYPNAGTIHKKAGSLLNREFAQQTINTHWGVILPRQDPPRLELFSQCSGFEFKTSGGLGIVKTAQCTTSKRRTE